MDEVRYEERDQHAILQSEHDGEWLVGADPTVELAARVNLGGYPTAAVIDASGRLRWSESGIHTADELVARIEAVLEG